MAKDELTRLYSQDKGTRPKVMFLLTDGTQSLGEKVADNAVIAREIRSLGVRTIVIGIGANINVKELESIAGDSSNVFLISHITELVSDNSLRKFSDIGCKAGNVA